MMCHPILMPLVLLAASEALIAVPHGASITSAGNAVASQLSVDFHVNIGDSRDATASLDDHASSDAPPDTAPPTLDDLLGIGGEDRSGEDAAERERRDGLQRELTEREVAGAFTAAIEQMAVSAQLLRERFDSGIGTQRIQEDIIAKLDSLIDSARRSPQSSSSSSGSAGDSQSEQDPGMRPPSPPNAGNQDQQPDDSRDCDSTEGELPQSPDADPADLLDVAGREWGNLPDRVRDMMLQGSSGRYSSLYRTLTQEYYRRLAEEDSP